MADELSPRHGTVPTLRFACSCVSAAPVSDDPWANVSKQRRFNDGTKELILNAIHRRPRTVAQLADELDLSPPAVHRHVTDLLSCELIREVDVPARERRSAVARYYALNFPVVLASDRQELLPILEEVAGEVAEVFRRRQEDLGRVYARTSLPARGAPFEQLLHWLYTAVGRMGREQLEEQGVLPPWPEHGDGTRWLWWAEESLADETPRIWEVR